MEQPTNTEILHTYMLWYQEQHRTAPSLRVIVDALPMWKSVGSVQHHIYKLAHKGAVEKRIIGKQAQWWALDILEYCHE